jgi:hypothetical protein
VFLPTIKLFCHLFHDPQCSSSLYSEYSLSFVALTLLILRVARRNFLIHHLNKKFLAFTTANYLNKY